MGWLFLFASMSFCAGLVLGPSVSWLFATGAHIGSRMFKSAHVQTRVPAGLAAALFGSLFCCGAVVPILFLTTYGPRFLPDSSHVGLWFAVPLVAGIAAGRLALKSRTR
jgi:hypothetical protein